MNHFFNWQELAGSQAEKFYKTTLWSGEHLMVGLNCLEPEQVQKVHAHDGADKFYFVLEGSGRFSIGDQEQDAAAGTLVIAPSGILHGVTNNGKVRLSLMVAIAPTPK
jgi:quercetin dioxygenase-like cupin family protein